MNKYYFYDSEKKVYRKNGFHSISYSDGDTTENEIFKILTETQDVSCGSDELQMRIHDWPTEYHLSWARSNLLIPLNLSKKSKVLELGCGCGAITRYLGENTAEVVSVEGSLNRAKIASLRCRDLDNVKIYCDNISDFKTEDKFDVVTLIGVLEYSRKYIHADDPIAACLACARSFLNDGGILVLAIENQLGLKYFNGFPEDHTGEPFFGVNDLYSQKSVVTFGSHELESILLDAGFLNTEWYYPFPDYKLPQFILSAKGNDHPKFNLENFLCEHASPKHSINYITSFFENRAWAVIARNKLIPAFSNSFLIVASPYDFTQKEPNNNLLGVSFNSLRKRVFVTRTNITSSSRNEIEVSKSLLFSLHDGAEGSVNGFHHSPLPKSKYHEGTSLALQFVREVSAGNFSPDSIKIWLNYLFQQTNYDDGILSYIPGNYLDCTPRNLVKNDDGQINYFDDEWVMNDPIPIAWVIIRGLAISLHSCIIPDKYDGMTVKNLVDLILKNCDVTIPAKLWEESQKLEVEFQAAVYNKVDSPNFSEAINEKITTYSKKTIHGRFNRLRQTNKHRITMLLKKSIKTLKFFAIKAFK